MTEFALVNKYGLTDNEIKRRLAIFGVGPDDAILIAAVKPAIVNEVESLVQSFYSRLFDFPELARFLSHAEVASRLRMEMGRYLLTLGESIESPEYVEGRLRVGVVHDRIGVPLKGYLGAYAGFQYDLSKVVGSALADPATTASTVGAINRVILFDVSLAVETYHIAALDRSEHLIAQLEANQEQIRRLSQTDYLTGVMNRRSFVDSLDGEIQRCQRYGNALSVLMIDIDNFKSINDSHGHQAGDAILKKVAHTLSTTIRMTDRCGRWGGEEFAVLMPETDLDTAQIMAERIRLAIIHEEVAVSSKRLMASVSIGVATWRDATLDAARLVDHADMAMYAAKVAGKNCVRVAETQLEACTAAMGAVGRTLARS